jgi:hypothetical protein
MKRVQLILEEWQHTWLAAEAEEKSSTMSALLRELLTEAIERRQTAALESDPLWAVVGIGEGPDDGVTSENLDSFLYRASEPALLQCMVAETTRPLETRDETDGNRR